MRSREPLLMMRDFWVGALYAAVATPIGGMTPFWYLLGVPGRSYDGSFLKPASVLH
jgi:hypothetical protein